MSGERRLQIAHTEEGFAALAEEVCREPVPKGDGLRIALEVISGDRFVWHRCLRCGMHGALFAYLRRFVSLCPQCTVERIERAAWREERLPPAVLWLHWEAKREAERQRRLDAAPPSVELDDFFRCHHCGRLGLRKDARYWGPPGSEVLTAHCARCRDRLEAGREKPREDRPWERKFEFPES